MKFGKFEIQPVETGLMLLDGGAMFGVVPKNLWSRAVEPDEKNRILMSARSMLIRTGDRNILIDTGVGNKITEKFAGLFGIDFTEYTLERSLKSLDVQPEEITDVILTHLHFDHSGGATEKDGTAFSLTFPNAMHYVQKKQWDWALNPSERDRASYFPENYLPLREAEKLALVEGSFELFDGIELLEINGHTFGQQLVKIRQGSDAILFCGDLIPMSAHTPLPYIMGYDLQPLVTLQEKKGILNSAAESNEILFFEHDPHTEAARVSRDERGYHNRTQGSLETLVTAEQKGER